MYELTETSLKFEEWVPQGCTMPLRCIESNGEFCDIFIDLLKRGASKEEYGILGRNDPRGMLEREDLRKLNKTSTLLKRFVDKHLRHR